MTGGSVFVHVCMQPCHIMHVSTIQIQVHVWSSSNHIVNSHCLFLVPCDDHL